MIKTKLLIIYILTITSLQVHSQISEQGLRSFEHENPGCPINSICSKKSGNLLVKWEKLLGIMHIKNRKKAINSFHKLNGSPIHFLSKKQIHKENKEVVLWNSRCRIHNPKNPHNAIYKGIIFTSKVPKIEGITLDTIRTVVNKKVIEYKVGYEDRPIFMKAGRLFFLNDFEDYFYQSSIDLMGNIKIENIRQTIFTRAQSKMVKEVPCPKELKPERNPLYTSNYCQNILNKDTGKLITININWSCP